jgi:hypothetical protein
MCQIGKAFIIGIVLIAIFGAVAYLGVDIAGRAMQMEPAKTSAATYRAAKAGAPVKAIVEIDTRQSDGTITAHLLMPVTETNYRKTPTLVRARVEPAMRVIMGTADDVKPGAIAQFDGLADGGGGMTLSRVVILSAYLRVVAS